MIMTLLSSCYLRTLTIKENSIVYVLQFKYKRDNLRAKHIYLLSMPNASACSLNTSHALNNAFRLHYEIQIDLIKIKISKFLH